MREGSHDETNGLYTTPTTGFPPIVKPMEIQQ
jgi:hypothetical protein